MLNCIEEQSVSSASAAMSQEDENYITYEKNYD